MIVLRFAASLVALVSLGCAALPWPGPGPTPPTAREPDARGWLDLRGVVHVHTRDSHDSPGRLDDLADAALSAGVAWVALTEHTRPGGPPASGRIRGVTIIPGYELRAFGGSLLALGIDALPDAYHDPARAIAAIHRAGGVALVGHLERSGVTAGEFADLGVDGVEIVNLHGAANGRGLLRNGASVFLPGASSLRGLDGMPPENLQRWDELPGDTIVGGVDAHAKLRIFGPLGGTVDTYARTLRLATTHVLARDASPEAILDALRAGRSYVAFERKHPVERFVFQEEEAGYRIVAPQRARLVLVCDGREVAAEEGVAALLVPPDGAERCRGEAWLDDRLWIVHSYDRTGVRSPR